VNMALPAPTCKPQSSTTCARFYLLTLPSFREWHDGYGMMHLLGNRPLLREGYRQRNRNQDAFVPVRLCLCLCLSIIQGLFLSTRKAQQHREQKLLMLSSLFQFVLRHLSNFFLVLCTDVYGIPLFGEAKLDYLRSFPWNASLVIDIPCQ
jgi:hypothetical protein